MLFQENGGGFDAVFTKFLMAYFKSGKKKKSVFRLRVSGIPVPVGGGERISG